MMPWSKPLFTDLQACNFIKNRLQHRIFFMNIAKFLKTTFFYRTLLVAVSEQNTTLFSNKGKYIGRFTAWLYFRKKLHILEVTKLLENINFTKKLKRFSNCSKKLLLFKDMILQYTIFLRTCIYRNLIKVTQNKSIYNKDTNKKKKNGKS